MLIIGKKKKTEPETTTGNVCGKGYDLLLMLVHKATLRSRSRDVKRRTRAGDGGNGQGDVGEQLPPRGQWYPGSL